MPAAAHPNRRDFFVYTFKLDGYPFYVGVGRDKRASDRIRFIKNLMANNPEKLKSLSDRVIAALLDMGKTPTYSQTHTPMNRRQALEAEEAEIARLVARGFLLTNWYGNDRHHKDVRKAVRAILNKTRSR
jgi:hypothetical protein